MSKYIGIFVFVFSLFSLGVHAGESFRFRVYLEDKGDSGYTLDNPEEYLSKESVERRSGKVYRCRNRICRSLKLIWIPCPPMEENRCWRVNGSLRSWCPVRIAWSLSVSCAPDRGFREMGLER